MTTKILGMAILAAVSLTAAAPSAYACKGVGGCAIGGKAGAKLDREHARMGNPLTHAANAGAGTLVGIATANPAAGAATTSALEAREAARRNGH